MPRLKKPPKAIFWRHRESIIVAVLLIVAMTILLIRAVPTEQTCVFGDMRLRYQARVPPESADLYLDATRIKIGFGSGAIGGWNGLGDALAVGGHVFVRHTNRASPRYYNLATNQYFQSNAFVFVPAERTPRAHFGIESDMRIDQLLDTLATQYPQGVIAAGLVRFAALRSIAMSSPAIDGEPVTLRAVRFYKRPMETADDSWAYVVLIAARDKEETLMTLLPPEPMRTGVSGHALALRLREWLPVTSDDAFVANAVSVGQLVKDAIAVQGQLELYPVVHAAACPNVQTSEHPR